MDDNNKYRDLFFEETDEYLQRLNEALLVLEKNPDDHDVLDEIFRAAHTLKGMAATMGYETMTELTHHMENVLELFRSGASNIDSDMITLIFTCLDTLSEIVEDLREGKDKEYNIKDLLETLDSSVANGNSITGKKEEDVDFTVDDDTISDTDRMVIQNASEKSFYAYHIAVKLSKDCLLKGARAYLVTNTLEKHGDILKTEPYAERLEEGDFGDVFKLIYISKLVKDSIKEIILGISEVEAVIIESIDTDEIALTSSLPQEVVMDEDTTGKPQIVEEATKNDEKGNVHHINQSIRVDLNRLDSFMNLVSELVIYRTRLEDVSKQFKATEISEPLEHVARITSELQDLVLKIRMQPVNVVFNRFPRMIRDLSKELDKEIELVIEGEETELDRTVVSELGEPLVHLMRNAADHGIESIKERVKLGKDTKGLVKLSAYQEGNRVVITISDDGRGIDPEVIKESAIRKGIDTQGLNSKELIQLIFNQGFSTVKNVSNISGRGVGMDVVRQKITTLGGTIDLFSEVNKGSTFVIKLPLTLSIIQALMVKVGTETFALPLGIIEKVIDIKQNQILKSHHQEVFMYRESAIPIVRVDQKLGIESTGENNHLILILLGEQHYGLLVNNFMGQQEIVIKKLGGALGRMKEYLGATILGNGDITLILDVGNLINEGNGDELE